MNHLVDETAVTIQALPDFPAEQVRAGIPAESLADAHRIVARLGEAARACPTPTPTPTPSPTLSPPDCIEATS